MTKQLLEAYKRNLQIRTGLKLDFISDDSNYEIGKTYFSGYWNQTFNVIDYKDLPEHWMGFAVTCKWQDGQITSHCTELRWDKDFMVV